MPYTETNWIDEEPPPIDHAHLQNMEEGIRLAAVRSYLTGAVQRVDFANGNDGWDGLSEGNAKATLQGAHDALPAGGGVIDVACGALIDSKTFLRQTKPLWIRGKGIDQTVVEMTGPGATSQHAITCTVPVSLLVDDMTVSMATPLAADFGMKAINLGLDSATDDVSNVMFHARRVKSRGFNFSAYASGRSDLASRLRFAAVDDCDFQNSQLAGHVGECVDLHRSMYARIWGGTLDNNGGGDHNAYLISNDSVLVGGGVRLLNAPQYPVKMTTDAITGTVYRRWAVQGAEMINCGNPVFAQLLGTNEILRQLDIDGIVGETCSDSTGLGAAIFVQAAGNGSVIGHVMVRARLRDCQTGGMLLQTSTGGTIKHVTVESLNVDRFSLASSGVSSALNDGGLGTVGRVDVLSLYADGAGTGRQALNLTIAQSVNALGVYEINTTLQSAYHYPITLPSGARLFSRAGTPNGVITGNFGDVCLRTDVPTTSPDRYYVCTSNPSGTTWSGIL